MPDYQKNVNYKIVCNDSNITDTYVGHSCDLDDRKGKHKSCCNNPNDKTYNYKVYQGIREYGGWDNWTVEVIEEYPCKDELEATLRERYWFEQLSATLNSIFPTRTRRERDLDNADKIYEQQRKWREEHADTIAEQKKKWYEANIAKIKEQHRKWHEANKAKNLERMKKYREEHRDELNQKKREKRKAKAILEN